MFNEKKRLLFLGLPWTFTNYIIKEDLLTIKSGIFTKIENDCFMYKIQDVKLQRNILERLFGIGTITCYTGDTTHPQIILVHIKNYKEIKEYILEMSEKARIKRRTLNTLNINADSEIEEVD